MQYVFKKFLNLRELLKNSRKLFQLSYQLEFAVSKKWNSILVKMALNSHSYIDKILPHVKQEAAKLLGNAN